MCTGTTWSVRSTEGHWCRRVSLLSALGSDAFFLLQPSGLAREYRRRGWKSSPSALPDPPCSLREAACVPQARLRAEIAAGMCWPSQRGAARSSLRYQKPDREQTKRLRGAGPLQPPLRISSPGITLRANGGWETGFAQAGEEPSRPEEYGRRRRALTHGPALFGVQTSFVLLCLPPNDACASLGPSPAAQARLSDSGSNFLRSACSLFPALSALRSQGIPGSSGWILFGLTHHHQSCQLIQAEGDDVWGRKSTARPSGAGHSHHKGSQENAVSIRTLERAWPGNPWGWNRSWTSAGFTARPQMRLNYWETIPAAGLCRCGPCQHQDGTSSPGENPQQREAFFSLVKQRRVSTWQPVGSLPASLA